MKNKKNMKKNPNAFPDQVNKNVEKYIYHTNLLDRLKKSGREREKEWEKYTRMELSFHSSAKLN